METSPPVALTTEVHGTSRVTVGMQVSVMLTRTAYEQLCLDWADIVTNPRRACCHLLFPAPCHPRCRLEPEPEPSRISPPQDTGVGLTSDLHSTPRTDSRLPSWTALLRESSLCWCQSSPAAHSTEVCVRRADQYGNSGRSQLATTQG